tara:strand:+ start:30978 stop:31532 length:555 start_codon:yes stop_codon:yes gene_type:complete
MNLAAKLDAAAKPVGRVARSKGGIVIPFDPRGKWGLRVRDKAGKIIETREFENLVTTEGQNYLLSAGLDGGAQTTTWYVLLTDGTPTVAAGNTLPSHAGWVEVADYAGSRPAWVGGTAAAGSIDNVASVASFAINADGVTIGGAGLCAVATGTAGVLYSVGAFSGGDLVLNDGSTLEVTATFTV